jgi:hypothetical protein
MSFNSSGSAVAGLANSSVSPSRVSITGRYPQELIFDSKLTTYANLSEMNRLGSQFITLRRRSPGLKQEIDQMPSPAWRRIELKGVSRKFKNPRILDARIGLAGYDGPLRQVTATDQGD